MNRFRGRLLLCPALCLSLYLLASSPLPAQTTSRWSPAPDSTDWFDALNWSDGVPNAPGDIAQVVGSTIRDVQVDVTAPATIGTLQIPGFGAATIGGTGPLVFDNPGDDPAKIETFRPRSTGVDATVATPISIADGEVLTLNVVQGNGLTLSGGIVSMTGDVTKTGAGVLTLSGDSSGWEGSLTVDEGDLVVSNINALTSSRDVLIRPGKTLTFVSQRDADQPQENYVVPNLTLDGGTIQTNDGSARRQTDLDANIHLLSDSTIQVTTDDTLSFYGEINGPGGVSFLQLVDPTVNVGLTNRTVVNVRGPTSYSGETYIGPNIRVTFETSMALGDSNGGTRVFQGELQLKQPGGSEWIEVEQGELYLGPSTVPYVHNIVLKQARLSGGADEGDSATLAQPVQYERGALLGGNNSSDELVLSGGIQGTGSLVLRSAVELAGPSAIRGNLYYPNFGFGAKLSSEMDIAGEIFVTRGSLELSGDIQAPDEVIHVVATSSNTEAVLRVSHNNVLDSVILDPRAFARNFFERFAIEVLDSAVLTVTDELRFMGGRIRGAVAGQSTLVKKSRGAGFLEDIAGSEFEQIIVEGGVLTLSGDAGDASPEIHLGSHDTSRVEVRNAGVYNGDIHLNNALGNGDNAALTAVGNTVLAGNIYLGDIGSSLSAVASSGKSVDITGSIHGGDVTFLGRGDVRIRGNQHTYTGTTNIGGERVILIDQGALNSTAAINGAGRITFGGGRGSLILDNSGSIAHSDRIPDATPVFLSGMKMTLIGRDAQQLTETLGTVHALPGTSQLVVQNPNTPGSETVLLIQNLQRHPGSVVIFEAEDPGAKILLAGSHPLDNNLIGGWALTSSGEDFATYGPNGVVPYSSLHSYVTDLPSALASDNVFLASQRIALLADKNVNSLNTLNNEIDLGGNLLTLESGGLIMDRFSDVIRGGQLTSGQQELFVHGQGQIAADIVDNAAGAVQVTYAPRGTIRLSGNNTYGGVSVVNATSTVELVSETALPSGGDVFLNGAELRITYSSPQPLNLGRLELTDNASLRHGVNDAAGLTADSLLIESGTISVDILGDVPITKTGLGISQFFESSLANHTGPIQIESGVVEVDLIGPAPIDNDHAITIHRRGRLGMTRDFIIADRKLRLDGGVMEFRVRGGVSAPIEVLEGGGYIRNEGGSTAEVTSAVTGAGDLTIEGGFGGGRISFGADLNAFEGELHLTGGSVSVVGNNRDYTQPVHITGAEVEVGNANALGRGKVTIQREGRLTLESTLRADLELAGGILDLQTTGSGTPRLTGDLTVSKDSLVFVESLFSGETILTSPVISSSVNLSDGVNLQVVIDPAWVSQSASDLRRLLVDRLLLTGEIRVDGYAAITSYDAKVNLTGRIVPVSADAILNLVGNDTFHVGASIHIGESNSFALLFDGESAPLSLSGINNNLHGNGTYVGDISFSGGAAVSPGDSAGLLTIDGNANLGLGSRFIVELGGLMRGDEYDALDVTGLVSLAGSLNLSLIDGFVPSPDDGFVLLKADHIDGMFSNAAESITVGGVELPVIYRSNMVVLGNAAAVVPEPHALALLLLGLTGLAWRTLRRCKRSAGSL